MKTDKSLYTDYPFDECVEGATTMILNGATIYQKWTCEHCHSRQGMEVPNRFYTEGKCEECGKITNIRKNGCNYMAHIMLGGANDGK